MSCSCRAAKLMLRFSATFLTYSSAAIMVRSRMDAGISDTRSGRKWPSSCAASHSDDSSPHTKKADVRPSSLLRTWATMFVSGGHLALHRRMASCRSISCISVATGSVRSSTISSDRCDSNCRSKSGVMCSSRVHGKWCCRDKMS